MYIAAVVAAFCVAFTFQAHAGINPTLLSSESEVTINNDGTEAANFLLHFKVKALDEDAYIPFVGLSLDFHDVEEPRYEFSNIYLYSTADSVPGDHSGRFYRVDEGSEERFTYVFTMTFDRDTRVSGGINFIAWNEVPSSEAPFDSWGGESHPVTWQTDAPLFVKGVPEPSSLGLILLTGLQLGLRRKRSVA